MMAKYFATSLAMEKVVSEPTGDEELLADLNDVDELGGVGVQVDHVPGLLRRRGPRVHRDADVGLRQGWSVVRAVAGHRDELAALLFGLDQSHLRFGGRLSQEIVDTGLLRDGRGGQRVVAGDHHGADAHLRAARRTSP
jgi:hypothetical protein